MLKSLFKHAFRLSSVLEYHDTDIIPWACPVPFFGDITRAKIATVGINPSNLEFVDDKGRELQGVSRRFNSLHSLNLESWKDATEVELNKIASDCKNYFNNKPYDRWFKRLDYIISGSSYSYYFPSGEACHIDLVPFATANKWSNLSGSEQLFLLERSSEILHKMATEFNISTLILNGQSVVNQFQNVTNCSLVKRDKPEWNLRRGEGNDVIGYSYEGTISGREGTTVKVLGFNHNIQSSFGVTKEVQESIRKWIMTKI